MSRGLQQLRPPLTRAAGFFLLPRFRSPGGGLLGPRPRSRRLFRWLALLAPLLVLAGLEGGLRLVGFGYPTAFLVPSRVAGETWLRENPKFGWRFFPPALARSPLPLTLTRTKPKGTYRILILGESAAQGHPAPAFGFSRFLAVLLQERYPSLKFEVDNLAMTAINSHAIRLIAQDVTRLQADLWILYLGHNEVVGPFGAGTIFGPRAPGWLWVRARLVLTATKTGQLLEAISRGLVSSGPHYWQGLELFAQQQVPAADPRLENVYANFEKNLQAIIGAGSRAGARVLLCTVASNLKDCPPFVSAHRRDLTEGQRREWKQQFDAAIAWEAAGNWTAAAEGYQRAAALDDQYAELQFRWARCCLNLRQVQAARRHFVLARDDDALRLRADSRLNQIILHTASALAGSGVSLADVDRALSQRSPEGVPGAEFFYEHVHLNPAGNYWVARTLAAQVSQRLPTLSASPAVRGEFWLTKEQCLQRLGWTGLNEHQVARQMSVWLQQPPFSAQLDSQPRTAAWEKKAAEWQAYGEGEQLKGAMERCRVALAAAPDDWMLRENLADHLEQGGEAAGAVREWRSIGLSMAHYERAWLKLGALLDQTGQRQEAQAAFEQALHLRPDSFAAHNGLGLCCAHLGRYAAAVKEYERALRTNPDFVEARVNLGLARLALGDVSGAAAEEEKALQTDGSNVAAHINLGKILESQSRLAEAQGHFARALRLQPDHAVAHYNMANVLAARGQWPAAREHYQETIRLSPRAPDARLRFGDELARRGQFEEAAQQFSAAVALVPADPEAHFLLGAVLSRLGRRPEAAAQLREAIRLKPAHLEARQLLVKLGQPE